MARLGLGPVLVLNFLYPSIRVRPDRPAPPGSWLGLGPVLVHCTNCIPAVDSDPVLPYGPVPYAVTLVTVNKMMLYTCGHWSVQVNMQNNGTKTGFTALQCPFKRQYPSYE